MWPAKKPIEIKACVENFYIVFVMPLPMTNCGLKILSFDLK